MPTRLVRGTGAVFLFPVLPLFLLLSLSSPALAQDFGVDWLDRVTHEMEQEDAPLDNRPAKFSGWAGLLYTFDNNIFLAEDEDADSILTVWGRGRVDYSEPTFDAAADLMLNYKIYFDNSDESGFEARFFGRMRYAGPRVNVELAEILRRESDPIDSTFVERVDRIVSNTIPRVNVDVTDDFSIETTANIQLVKFSDGAFEHLNNLNWRADMAFLYHASQIHDVFLDVGYLSIDYSEDTPDVTGFYGHLGYRGQPREDINLEAKIGFTKAESDDAPITGESQDESTFDMEVHVRYQVKETTVLYGDLARRIGFGTGPADPFETVTRFIASVQHDFNQQLKGRARLQYDNVEPPQADKRSFFSLGASMEYRFAEHWAGMASLTFRSGDAGNEDFSDIIFSLGVVASY